MAVHTSAVPIGTPRGARVRPDEAFTVLHLATVVPVSAGGLLG